MHRARLMMLCLAPWLLALGCQSQLSHAPKFAHEDDDISCGGWRDRLQSQAANSNYCQTVQDCDHFAVCTLGCWVPFNRTERDKLLALEKQLRRPECQLFNIQYKCNSTPPGTAVCKDNRCQWQVTAGKS